MVTDGRKDRLTDRQIDRPPESQHKVTIRSSFSIRNFVAQRFPFVAQRFPWFLFCLGPMIKEFKTLMASDAGFQARLSDLRNRVEDFAETFPMPGYDDW